MALNGGRNFKPVVLSGGSGYKSVVLSGGIVISLWC